jgi:hypothetical protein
VGALLLALTSLAAPAPLELGSRRQLLLDDALFERRDNLEFRVQVPEVREVVLRCDQPWERKVMHYSSVVQDEGRYRMWYRVDDGNPRVDQATDRTWTCYAESRDGIRWEKPALGLVAHGGSTRNNIVLEHEKYWNASILLDPSQPAGSDSRYKMIQLFYDRSDKREQIHGFVSKDGLNWRPAAGNPFLADGPFDSHNTLLWDQDRRRYVIYARGVDRSVPGPFFGGRRAIRRSESADFEHWSPSPLVVTTDRDDPPDLHIYTNAAVKYTRAADAWVMFPMVLYPNRAFPGAPYPQLSDVQFAWSRDGIRWQRPYRHPYLRAGLDERNWVDRNPIVGQGIVQTGPTEISLYFSELFRSPESRIRRATLRTDGFVSLDGPFAGSGEATTRPLRFAGRRLELNNRTSGRGAIQVEIQDESGRPVPGFALADCPPIFGDRVEGFARWKDGDDVSKLSGRSIRLRLRLRDASLYSFRFAP